MGLFLGSEPFTGLIQQGCFRCSMSSEAKRTVRIPKALWFGTRMATYTVWQRQRTAEARSRVRFLSSRLVESSRSCTPLQAERTEADRKLAC